MLTTTIYITEAVYIKECLYYKKLWFISYDSLVDVNWLFVIIKSYVKVNLKERNNNNNNTNNNNNNSNKI